MDGEKSIEDLIDWQWKEKEKNRIKELLASSMTDNCCFDLAKIEQIAKEADRDPLEVLQIAYQIQETKRENERSTERRKQDISNLESDPVAIQTIKDLLGKGLCQLYCYCSKDRPWKGCCIRRYRKNEGQRRDS